MKWICEPGCSVTEKRVNGNGWTFFTGMLVLLMPKCAFCWAAYMSILSSIGLVTIPYKPWFLAVAVTLFILTLVKLLYSAVRSRHYAAFITALIAGIIIAVYKFWIPVEGLNYIAVVLMIVAVTMDYFLKLAKRLLLRLQIYGD